MAVDDALDTGINLLADGVFQTATVPALRSFPEVLSAMAAGETVAFPRLRPHQRPAWHMFMSQLAALALWRAGQTTLPTDVGDWTGLLQDLTPEGEAPWCMIGPDRRSPAFLQPPDPGRLKWTPVQTPDELDMLITSRNHDLKSAIGQDARVEDWVFALVSLQTMEGYGGAGNHGIARMNGGSSSRMCLSLMPARQVVDMAPRWRRDVLRMLILRSEGAWSGGPCAQEGGHALLWCLPWTDGGQLYPQDLDPWCIEVCRRVRFIEKDGNISAEKSTSKAARIDAKAHRGALGDPWAPVHRADNKAYTISERDLDYVQLCTLIGADFVPPALALPGPGEGPDLDLVAEVIARGNSKTFGFRSRRIPVPARAARLFGTPSLGDVAQAMVEDDIAPARKALGDALSLLAARGDWQARGKDDWARATPAQAAFHRQVDRHFFAALWDRLAARETGPDEAVAARLAFVTQVQAIARDVYQRECPAIPCPTLARPRAQARADRVLDVALKRARAGLEQETHDHDAA